MANVSSTTYYEYNEQYVGDLIRIGAGRTPFMTMMGGLNGTNVKIAKDWRFALNSQYSLESASVPSITEATAASAGTPTTYDKGQDYNVCQIFRQPVSVTYAAQSATSHLSGLPIADEGVSTPDPLAFQIMANMEQLALNVDYTFINGTKHVSTGNTDAWQTGGILASVTSNAINADSGYTDDVLSTTMIDDAMTALADTSKAPMKDLWVLCNAGTKKKLSNLYGNTPLTQPGTNVGGQAIDTIITDFGQLKLMYEPQMPAGYLSIVDMAYVAPVVLPVPGKGYVFYETLAQTGAAVNGQIYAQLGLGFTAEEYHAKIFGFDLS